jgi:hypothetical protein
VPGMHIATVVSFEMTSFRSDEFLSVQPQAIEHDCANSIDFKTKKNAFSAIFDGQLAHSTTFAARKSWYIYRL